MLDRLPRRLRVAFNHPADGSVAEPDPGPPADDRLPEVAFVAYGEDCILSGRTSLDADRLSDMLNSHDEYDLVRVTVDRLDGGSPIRVDEVVVPRDELFMVHASGPPGDRRRRQHTTPQHLAVKMGPYRIRGFYHGVPGNDPVIAISRRKTMVPLTNARVTYERAGDPVEITVDVLIVNRDQIDWVAEIEPDRAEFPVSPKAAIARPA
jgi:hypothetical protein